jgi:hypothetical protein
MADYVSLIRLTGYPKKSLRRFGNIASAQSKTRGFELACIVQRKIRRPAALFLDQLDRNLGDVFTFTHAFDISSLHALFRVASA